jgi:hypothetical protein
MNLRLKQLGPRVEIFLISIFTVLESPEAPFNATILPPCKYAARSFRISNRDELHAEPSILDGLGVLRSKSVIRY